MSKEKQIEEIIKVLNSPSIRWGHGDTTDNDIAEELYNAGYRKQSEGEWIVAKTERAWNDAEYPYMHRCSMCGNEEASQSLTPFCPNCGAKMKGGAE